MCGVRVVWLGLSGGGGVVLVVLNLEGWSEAWWETKLRRGRILLIFVDTIEAFWMGA